MATPLVQTPVLTVPAVAPVVAAAPAPAQSSPPAAATALAVADYPEISGDTVLYTEYSNSRLTCSPPEERVAPPQPGSPPGTPGTTYKSMAIQYNYGTPTKKMLKELILELPEMHAHLGLQNLTIQGKPSDLMIPKFELGNPEHQKLMEILDQVYMGCAHLIFAFRGLLGKPYFKAEAPWETGVRHFVSYPVDDNKMPKKHEIPSLWFKLFKRGKAPNQYTTKFFDLNGQNIPWDIVSRSDVKFIPFFRIKSVYAGSTIAIQSELASAVITSIKPAGSTTFHLGTIARLRAAQPDLVDTVSAQLAKLQTARQDQILGAHQEEKKDSEPDQPSFAGIQRQNAPAALPAIPAVPGNAGFPAIPALPGNPASIGDLTAGAPVRIPGGAVQLN